MPFLKQLLQNASPLHLGELGRVGRRTITHFFGWWFVFFSCLIYSGCTHYPASLGNSNELCGTPAVSQRDFQHVSVSLIKSRPYFPLGISVSLQVCSELLDAIGGRCLTSAARWLRRIWSSFALLLHNMSFTGYPFNMEHQSALAVSICSFIKPVMKELAGLSESTW